MDIKELYAKVLSQSRELSTLWAIEELLGWDQETYMPAGGTELRGEHRAYVAGLAHDRLADPLFGDWLEQLHESAELAELGEAAVANVRELRRRHLRERRVPAELARQIARTESLARDPWVQARQTDDFAQFAPWLEKLIKLKREWTEAVGYEQDPYDALLEEYEPGTRAAELDELFGTLCPRLSKLVDRVLSSPRRPPDALCEGFFPIERQRELAVQVVSELGFDFKRGRLDLSVHPFCTGLADCDVRITTRYSTANPIDGLLNAVHEAGHAMYEQGLVAEHRGTPMAWPASYAVHESLSRWWEIFVGRSQPFWARFLPRMQGLFFDQLRHFQLDSFLLAVNKVRRSLIRVEADELTYNLHIAVRLEIERALLSGGLTVADVPDAWNERMARYVGVRPTRHADGSLQDIHWSTGAFGYFPSYTLGNIYAAQLHWRLTQDIPHWQCRIESGQFAELLEWMRRHIHRLGSLYPPHQLIEQATGQPPRSEFLIEYLENKYSELYGL